MTYREKIQILESYLMEDPENYRDSFKTDIYLFFNEDFSVENPFLNFLKAQESNAEIKNWVDLLASQIVLKFDEEMEQIGDFIGEFVEMSND